MPSNSLSARGRAGFTLIELLVAMVLGVLVAGIIFEVLRGQGRFVSVQSARQDAQQNARGALEVLTSELRAAPVQAIEAATATSITFRVPRAWGVYCGGTTGLMHVVFPNLADETYTPGSASGVMANTAGTAWEADAVSASATFNVDAVGHVCDAVRPNTLLDGTADGVTFTAATGASFNTATPVGAPVFLYDRVQYDLGDGPDAGELWIRRSNGLTSAGAFSMQPLAGPVPDQGGLALTYFTDAGAAIAVPAGGLAAATLLTVRRVGVSVTTQKAREGVTQKQTDSMTVHLRNRP
ncbi:MAG TPA: prepilin-type N-terminal cleavage/methylation domain-containing protein [Longimicrobium sp.]|nr:prepilin-type N-terminal cleavage/methylation domain-containing protein [Longimicrobium sp.]